MNYILIDYGVNNLFSVKRMINALGIDIKISADPDEIVHADKVILPGVGAFATAREHLRKDNLDHAIIEFTQTGKPLLGICLGMQLLFTQSEEFGIHKGLDLIPGNVVQFQKPDQNEFKIPQINWNAITVSSQHDQKQSILKDIKTGSQFYFVHSYICKPDQAAHTIAESAYGKDLFCAVAHKDNIWGCQFHPEKSGSNGMNLLSNFLSL